MNRTSTFLVPAVVLCVLAAAPTPGVAQTDTERVEALFAEGAALYRAGKYRAAIERFDAAYAIYPEPNLLYNKARAHEALGEIDAALDAYQRCAASPEVDAEVKAKAERKASMLEQAKATSAKVPAARAPSSGVTPGAGATIRAPDDGGSGLTVAKWGLLGVGAALAVTGSVFFALGAQDHGDISSAADPSGVGTLTRVEAQALSDDGTQKKTIGVGLGAGGIAALAGAALLFVLDGDDDAGQVAFGPTAGGAAVTWQGRF